MRAAPHLLRRSLVSGLVATALLCWGYQTATFYQEFTQLHAHRLLGGVQLVVYNAGTPAAAVLALALLWRASARAETRALALFLALLAYTMAGEAPWLWAVRHHWPRAMAEAVSTAVPLAAIAAIAALLEFSTVFPARLEASSLFDRPSRSQAGEAWRRLRARLLDRRIIWLSALATFAVLVLPVQILAVVRPGLDLPLFHLSRPSVVGVLALGMALAVLNLRSGARSADGAARRRLSWIIEGFLAGTAVVLLASAVKLMEMISGAKWLPWYALVVYAAFLLILGGLAAAMFYAGALDPALAIRKTAVFGLVGLAMVFLFSAIENAMQSVVASHLGMSDHLSGLLSGGLVALTFDPIKERSGRLVSRWSGRSRPSAEVGPGAGDAATGPPPLGAVAHPAAADAGPGAAHAGAAAAGAAAVNALSDPAAADTAVRPAPPEAA